MERRSGIRWHGALAVVLLAAATAMTRPALAQFRTPSASAPSVQSEATLLPAGWVMHAQADGMYVRTPSGWRVDERGHGGFVATEPGEGRVPVSMALVQPIEVSGSAADCVANVGRVAPDTFPDARQEAAKTLSQRPEVATGLFGFTRGGFRYRGAGLCVKDGSRAVLYFAAARESSWQSRLPLLKTILTGVVYAGTPRAGAGGGALPAMIEWVDPNENAFSVPVPRGWNVSGGSKRMSVIDVRMEVVVESPDGAVVVRIGDTSVIPMMVLPSGTVARIYPEGTTYILPDGMTTTLVLRYLPGVRYLTDFYLPQRVGSVGNLRINDLPQLAQAGMSDLAALAQIGYSIRGDAGEATFDVDTDAGARKGYAFCQTAATVAPSSTDPGSGTWFVGYLFGYLATPEREAQARAVLTHMTSGFRENPLWRHQQNVASARASGAAAQTMSEIGDEMYHTWARNSAARDASTERYIREAVRGNVLIQDPGTGQRFEVPNAGRYYWRAGPGDHFFGTESPEPPDVWVERMDRVE